MAKVNANYELMLIINPALGEEGIASVVERFKTLIEKNGTLAEVDEWGVAFLNVNPLSAKYLMIRSTGME